VGIPFFREGRLKKPAISITIQNTLIIIAKKPRLASQSAEPVLPSTHLRWLHSDLKVQLQAHEEAP
jgi:hypothetical protein